MKTRGYQRAKERRRMRRAVHEDLAALAVCGVVGQESGAGSREPGVLTAGPCPLTPVEELLLMHPLPWTAEVLRGNQADTIVRDALGYDIFLPGWGGAIAELLNEHRQAREERDGEHLAPFPSLAVNHAAVNRRLQWERE